MKKTIKSGALIGLMVLLSACGYSNRDKNWYSTGYSRGEYCRERGIEISAEDAWINENTIDGTKRNYAFEDYKGPFKAGFKDGIKGKRRRY